MTGRGKLFTAGLLLMVAVALSVVARAEGRPVELRFESHRFIPQTLTVSAGQPFKIDVVNASHETIEFESFKLNREKVLEPGATISVRLPALSPGTYDFYDDFHQDVPEGSIIAK